MKKDIVMKKSSFVNGALITTIGIIITKILGVLYVIPFHAIIGEAGGALYGYAYTIYLLFMSLSSAGIPLAISRIVSEYQTLGYYNIKKRAFVLGKRIALVLGIISVFFWALPLLNAILIILAVIFGIVGLTKKHGDGKAIAGLIISGIMIIPTVIMIMTYSAIGGIFSWFTNTNTYKYNYNRNTYNYNRKYDLEDVIDSIFD